MNTQDQDHISENLMMIVLYLFVAVDYFGIRQLLFLLARWCPVLKVGLLVSISPSGCATSQMTANTKCSFSCPQGNQLQGPSYKECQSSGQWTNFRKSVSCIGRFAEYGDIIDSLCCLAPPPPPGGVLDIFLSGGGAVRPLKP